MNNIYTFKNFLAINVSILLIKKIIDYKQGIRSSYPSRAIIFHSDNPNLNKENLAVYLKREIALNIRGAQSN